MALVPKREYLALLIGDLVTFSLALWISLALRNLDAPAYDYFVLHFKPFVFLFIFWIFTFFLAGLYARYARLMRSRLPQLIFYTQGANVLIAAAFFFLIPEFGIAPKTILLIYLVVSSILIFFWRVVIFPLVRPKDRVKAILLGCGEESAALEQEINSSNRYPVVIDRTLDMDHAASHEAVQQLCRVVEEDGVNVVIADARHPALIAALPIMYDAAFRKRSFAFLDTAELYETLFERVPLQLVGYSWILESIGSMPAYDLAKRGIDLLLGLVVGAGCLLAMPFVALAIKLEDGGPVFITQERIGQYQKPIYIYKFRSMSGNDGGDYGKEGKTKLTVTRVGKIIRMLRIDELPQVWNVLRGDLSFVGPRPELPGLAAHYSARIPFYNARHLVKPGLTGWAQIRHDRHPHGGADVVETKNKLTYDLFYLRHRSFLLDLFIMFQTARIVLFEKGS